MTALDHVAATIRAIQSGSVVLQIQNGAVVQIQSTEKRRAAYGGATVHWHGPWALLSSPAWRQIQEDGFVPDFPTTDRLLVPLPLWRARKSEFLEGPAAVALLLNENEDPPVVAADLHAFPVIVVAFATTQPREPLAWSLRQRYGYQGVIAALGPAPNETALLTAEGFDARATRSAAGTQLDETV